MHSGIRNTLEAAGALADLAWRLRKFAARRPPARTRPRHGSTLRPGPHTPLWNALVLSVRPHLRYLGAQSNLARMLGVPPQRVHEYFVRRSAVPDAERVLVIIGWLAQGAPALTALRILRRRKPSRWFALQSSR